MESQYNKLLSCIKEDSPKDELDYIYRIDDRGVVIEGYLGRKKNLVVPENIGNRPVYKIDDNAFYEDEKLEKITLPNTLRIIGKEAFACSAIEAAILPETLLIIEDDAFADSSLKAVNIPESVSRIGENAFSGTDITSIKIPSNVKSISEAMFNRCRKLHSVIIEGAKTIGESAFDGCEKLKNISLPDTLTAIEDNALNDTGIEYLIVPQSVNYIGENNFPKGSHIAVLSDETEFYLGDSDYSDYSTVTLYCNQTNKNARKAAEKFDMNQKSLASFAKASADYYMNFEQETSSEIAPPKVFNEPNCCTTKCEFYSVCQENKEICVKNVYGQILQTLTPREERVLRLIYGIEEYKESIRMVSLAFGITEERVEQIKAKALRKMRHPTRAQALLSTDVGLVLLSANETKYFNLWCAVFGLGSDCRRAELERYTKKKQAEEEQNRNERKKL